MSSDPISKIFDKLNTISVDVGIIKDKMPDLATKDHVDLKIAEHAALKPSMMPSKISGRMTAVILGALAALTAAVVTLTQLL